MAVDRRPMSAEKLPAVLPTNQGLGQNVEQFFLHFVRRLKHPGIDLKLVARGQHADHFGAEVDRIRSGGGGAGDAFGRLLKLTLGILHAAQRGAHYIHGELIGPLSEILSGNPERPRHKDRWSVAEVFGRDFAGLTNSVMVDRDAEKTAWQQRSGVDA